MTDLRMSWPDYKARRMWAGHRKVNLTPGEATFVSTLLMRRGQWVSLNELIEIIWPNPDREPDYAMEIVRNLAFRLRRKLGQSAIHTQFTWGYSIPLPDDAPLAAAA